MEKEIVAPHERNEKTKSEKKDSDASVCAGLIVET